MRHKDPELMKKIVETVDQFMLENRRPPCCREIMEHVPLKRTAVYNYLVAMNESGMIEYDGKTILTPAIKGNLLGLRSVGVVGSVACGLPQEANTIPDETMDLPVSMVGSEDMYILYAAGDSMIEAGIFDGDMVLVRRQETARNGDIVVAWVEGEGNTLKRFRREGKTIILHPENHTMQDIRVKECRVQGVVTWVFRRVS